MVKFKSRFFFCYNNCFCLGLFSDEGGHVSDDRPGSRESMIHSEPEHEWADQV